MAYLLYLLTGHLLLPLVFIRLLLKSRHSPQYRQRWSERLGFYVASPSVPPIWIHTVSVGEFNAAKPLIEQLLKNYPEIPLLVTTMTPTGSAAVTAYPRDLYHVYLPYDLPIAVNRFLNHWQPRTSIIFETEIWPVLFKKSAEANIPVIMANARLSEKSARSYRYIKPLITQTLQRAIQIAAATQEDANRLQQLGAEPNKLTIMGNIKFDYEPPANINETATQLRQQLLANSRPIWVAASTHSGEEQQVLSAHADLLRECPNALLILVPRHPERFDDVALLCGQTFIVTRRSTGQSCSNDTAIYLADTMGELPLFYAMADAVYVGGSLVPVGGHNLIEPAAASKAPLFGPHMHNFDEISRLLLAADGARQIADSGDLAQQVRHLLTAPDTAGQRGQRALNLVQQHQGATQRLTRIIATQLAAH